MPKILQKPSGRPSYILDVRSLNVTHQIYFRNNYGNPSSWEPYCSLQSGQPNGDDTIFRCSHRSFSLGKGALKNFAKFTGKQHFRSLFFNKVGG